MKNSYITRLFQSAWSITMSDFGFNKPRVLLLKAVTVIVSVFILFQSGLDGLVEDAVGERWSKLAALLFIIPAWFLVNLILAPARLQKISDARIEQLEEIIENERQVSPDMPIWDAIEHIRSIIGDDDFDDCYPATRLAIRQAALDGGIAIFGKKELPPPSPEGICSDVYTKIDSDYWEDYKVNAMAISEHYESHDHTWAENYHVNGYKNRYWALKVKSQEIMSVWQPEST